MQNFSNSPAPPSLPPGFSARGGGGPLYPPQPAEPQISPRMTDDYAGLQQQAQNLHRGHAHPGQASHMLAYSARNRGAVEAAPTQAGIHAGSSNNPYRKDVMDYYFSMGAKDRHRRGGMGYAAGFGYPNMDGHLPHQYRHAGSGSAASSGMMSYPAEYSAGAAAGAVAGAGAFSPSQFNMSQSPAMQAVPGAQLQHRQHGQTFPAVHHTPQQRSYPPHSGHRMTPQYPHYSPQSAASTGSSGMYSPPPQRYLDGAAGAGFDPKVNSSPSVNSSNSVSSSAAANNVGQMESVQQGYHAANYPGYPPQTHHKQATLQHRNSQHGLGVGYDSALKLQSSIQGPLASSAYGKHHQASASSLPQAAAQEIAKSPMHPAAQQPQINQNFSPISNPSPAASAVHSPSCSSSPSPLMGVAEAHVTPSGHAPSHPNPRSSHAQGRLLQTMPQLSPTPNSNSSISSCGSSGSHKAHSMSAAGGGGLPRSNKMGPSTGVGPREEGVYSASPLDKMQDSSLNSLSALSSQVANLPNTVQHMLLTDSVLVQKRGKDGGGQHGVPPRSRNASAASSTSTVKDGAAGVGDGAEEESSFGAKVEREEGFSEGEHGRVRQMSGASSGSEPAGYQMGQNVKTITSDSSKELKAAETKASSPVTTSVIAPAQPNCVSEPGLTHSDHRGGQGKLVEIKHEAIKSEGAAGKTDKGCSQDGEVKAQNGQAKDNRPHVGSRLHNNEEKLTSEEQQSAGGVGVIVSTHAEKRRPQDNCVDEKPPHSYFREASSHNGDEGMDLSLYSSHRQKSNFGQTQNPPHKYSHPESTYGSDLSTRNRGRAGAESNSRYLGYQQSQAGFVQQKEASSAAAEALVKRGSKGHEENSQLQQFPSLLQEVLQGYNLDRRYGRPEQAFPAHLQVQQYPSRHPYEAVRMQSGAGDGSTGKLPHPNQRHGNETDFPTEPQPLVKSEASSSKIMLNAEKAEAGASQSRLPQAAEAQPTPTKHINLADYSLPQRKALPGLSSSAVQELLLQEPEPLSEAHKSSTATVLAPSERRSVICDVSPNRRSTPERDREGEREKSQSGASVIQQPFSSPAAANDLSKKEIAEKQAVKMEAGSSKEASGESDHHGGGGANEADVEYHAKPAHSSGVINADPYRRGGGGGADVAHMPANPLSSPPRHQSFLHGVDLSASSSATFPGYRYGESREGGIIPRGAPHFPPHHPYHSLSPQTQSPNKLQMFRGPHHPHDMSDWVKAMSRTSKDVMVQPGSSPGRPKAGQSEQRPRMIPQSDVPGEHAGKASLHHQSPFFDLKMWEQSGREGVRIMEGDPFYRTTQAPPPAPASHGQADPEGVSRATEEAKHPLPPPPPPPSSTKPLPEVNSAPPKMQRPAKAGGSGDTNPLMLRRRVRSFISPIPAKRQLQERAATNSHHSPVAQTESSHHTEDDAAGSDVPCPRLSSPLLGESSFSQPVSPAGGGAKVLPPRKGRGLKLEAIVQKITPNIKKPTGHADEESNHYPGFSHPEVPQFNDSQDQDVAHFPRAAGDDSFMDEGHALNDMLPFRGVDDAGPLSSFTCDPHQTPKQQDFDFGLGSAASGSGDKEDFALLGPLPPPPPLPRPVQGSPPPSSSALSDIQHFTNTYQQLETRRGEQSAANLLRQKLQETGIGFDDYPAGDYYGATPPHPGHMLSRQMSSGRSSLSPQDTKPPESVVPKGYFPSGKKKGRPVGSVNKQKRTPNTAQTQAPPQNATISAPPAPLTPTPAAATPPPTVQTITTPTPAAVPPIIEPQVVPPLAPPVLTQVVKVDVESEDTQPEAEVKPARRRRKGVKDEDDPLGARGRQRRRRRGAAAAVTAAVKESLLGDGGSPGVSRVLIDPNRKGPFVPHIHVEKKVPEIGAVCTIVNAEEDKTKGGAAGGKGIESLLTSALKETEKREADEVEATLQSGKALPSSGFLVSGPVITETNHSGRLLCCLCQKWANYKHLGDLYGPFYPAEYAAKLPKNQPQVRQCLTNTASNKTGPSSDVSSNSLSSFQDSQTPDAAFKAFSESYDPMGLDSNPSSFASAFRTATLVGRDEMIHTWSTDSSAKTLSWDLNPPDIRPIPELKREPDLDVPKQPDEAQQRPQHRKLTSHPRFKRRHKSSEDSPRMVPSNSKASLPFQPPPPALDSLGPLAQLAQLPQMPMDPEELWVHEGCIVWTSGVYLVNGRLYGLQEALDGARETSCSYCDMVGSTLGCYSKGCTLRYHYLCAMEADCSLNEDNFSLRCPKHKFTQSIRPAKSVYLEQSERG